MRPLKTVCKTQSKRTREFPRIIWMHPASIDADHSSKINDRAFVANEIGAISAEAKHSGYVHEMGANECMFQAKTECGEVRIQDIAAEHSIEGSKNICFASDPYR